MPPPTLNYQSPQPPPPLLPIAANAYYGTATATAILGIALIALSGATQQGKLPSAFLALAAVLASLILPAAIFLAALLVLQSFMHRIPTPSARDDALGLAFAFTFLVWIILFIAAAYFHDLNSLPWIIVGPILLLIAPPLAAFFVTIPTTTPT